MYDFGFGHMTCLTKQNTVGDDTVPVLSLGLKILPVLPLIFFVLVSSAMRRFWVSVGSQMKDRWDNTETNPKPEA